jgi:CBS domain-containing protein
MHDVAQFLGGYEPFLGLDPAELERLARSVDIAFFARGTVILPQGQDPVDAVHVVRRGWVELRDGPRVLDLLGEGEMFGHPSLLAGRPTGLEVRAAEDTLSYRLPRDAVLPLLSAPAGMRFVARSLLERPSRRSPDGEPGAADPSRRRIASFLREPVVVCTPEDTIRDAARRMAQRGTSAALVDLGDRGLGILTDQDLRVRVVGGEVPLDAPVRRAMTAPAHTVTPERLGVDVMVEMIDRGIRHMPVVTARGTALGVVTDVDLLAPQVRTPFVVRRAIARAGDLDEVVGVTRDLPATIVGLHDARVDPVHVTAILAAVVDALTRRVLELLTHDAQDLPAFTWLATGSMGRQEAFPSSDVDSALVWEGPGDPEQVQAVADRALATLARAGFATDTHAASAARPLFARSVTEWRAAVDRWMDRPEDTKLLIGLSILEDGRPVHSRAPIRNAFPSLAEAHRHPLLLRRLLRLALSHRPPTGFLRDFVLEHSGERRGRLDIKRGGLLPIVDLARYAGLATGRGGRTTRDRLRGARDAGLLRAGEASTLEEAFEFLTELRLTHQVDQLRRGEQPDDFLDPAALSPLTRRYLREAFRAVAATQRGLSPAVPAA